MKEFTCTHQVRHQKPGKTVPNIYYAMKRQDGTYRCEQCYQWTVYQSIFGLQPWFGCFEMNLYVVLIFPANNCQIVFTFILDSSSISCLKHIIWIHTIVDVLASFPWILPHKPVLNTEKAEDFLNKIRFWSVPLSGLPGKKVGDPQPLTVANGWGGCPSSTDDENPNPHGDVQKLPRWQVGGRPNFHKSGMVQDLGVSKK